MKCLTCENDITQPVQQFGNPSNPICLSCHLAGLEWAQEDEEIVNELKHGASLYDAAMAAQRKNMSELQKFAESFFMECMK